MNGEAFNATGKGTVKFTYSYAGKPIHITLHDVLYAFTMPISLVSASRIVKNGNHILIDIGFAEVHNKANAKSYHIPEQNGLYYFSGDVRSDIACAAKPLSIDEVHQWLGHISSLVAKRLVKDGLIHAIKLDMDSISSFCTGCSQGKQTWELFPKERSSEQANAYGNLVHTDV